MKSYNSKAHKKAINLTVNSELLARAKEQKIDLSATLEKALEAQIKAIEREKWLEENSRAMDAYNEFVESEGVFSDGLRSF